MTKVMNKKIGVVSLGCDKNRVDTENMLYYLKDGNFEITNDYALADIIIVNTCAFIESARVEAIDTILDMAEYKKTGNCKQLIVTGCLPEKYRDQLVEGLPEVDAFLGVREYEKIAKVVGMSDQESEITDKRIITTPQHYAYLRIADGCDNHCTFCTIPSIRGKYKSVSEDNVLKQALLLEKMGVKEIILIAQDVTSYGKDIYGKPSLVSLLKKLSQYNFDWIRLMYCYPELVTDELIEEICTNSKIVKYIDIPLQHIDDGVLKLMNRRSRQADIVSIINKLRAKCPNIAIRTTFMVGFPSETEEQFENLCAFAKEYKLDHVGVFAYSKEDDTASAKIKGHLDDQTKLERVNVLGAILEENNREANEKYVGKTVKVLYEDIDYERNMFVGRTQYNAPEIDSVVYFTGDFADVGEFYNVKITAVDGYDLIGEIEQ
ncbi:MAG: 30S ribosomal protein S12 methylthiotransferase RimO [Clostridiales bacterium]|nr:30S ribosomal protein S12 methylthiotransferase RimO [Clostridiales bacterium]